MPWKISTKLNFKWLICGHFLKWCSHLNDDHRLRPISVADGLCTQIDIIMIIDIVLMLGWYRKWWGNTRAKGLVLTGFYTHYFLIFFLSFFGGQLHFLGEKILRRCHHGHRWQYSWSLEEDASFPWRLGRLGRSGREGKAGRWFGRVSGLGNQTGKMGKDGSIGESININPVSAQMCAFIFIILHHLKLELLKQFPASNSEK